MKDSKKPPARGVGGDAGTNGEGRRAEVSPPTPHYTPTERRILRVLADGLRHTSKELMACLDDDLASRNALHSRISHLRPKVQALGQEIVCEVYQNTYYYRHITVTPHVPPPD